MTTWTAEEAREARTAERDYYLNLPRAERTPEAAMVSGFKFFAYTVAEMMANGATMEQATEAAKEMWTEATS